MRSRLYLYTATFLGGLLVFSGQSSVLATTASATPATAIQQQVANPPQPTPPSLKDLGGVDNLNSDSVKVMVILKQQPGTPSSTTEQSNLANQSTLLNDWQQKYGLTVDRQFGYLINGFSATMPSANIARLATDSRVESVKIERVYYPTETNARELHGTSAAFQAAGVDGTGMVVSVIDTGIDATHQDIRLDDGKCAVSKIQTFDSAKGFTCKVPAGYNYADENYTIIDTTGSQHGQHVAGIIGANGGVGDSPAPPGRIDGIAPNAQLLAMKVFSNKGGGASDSDIIAAIEDSVKLKADVINMSLGTPNGANNTSDGTFRAIAAARNAGVITLVAAGNEGLNFSPVGQTNDTIGYFDDATIGTPAVFTDAFAIGSIDNASVISFTGYWNDGVSADTSMPYIQATGTPDGTNHELVDVGLGRTEDYTTLGITDLTGKYALIERGTTTFAEKYQAAIDHKAQGVVIFNSATFGKDFVNMSGIESFKIPGTSIHRSDALLMRTALQAGKKVNIRFTSESTKTIPTTLQPSSFSSWGPTPNLDFAPQISGIGGGVNSTLNANQYGYKSGTSMATPNVAGTSALLLQSFAKRFPTLAGTQKVDDIKTALMNTAQIPVNAQGKPFAPRQVGAGLARIDLALQNNVFATVNGKPYASLREVNAPTSFTVTLNNRGTSAVSYTVPAQKVLNETNAAQQDTTTSISSESLNASAQTITVQPGASAQVTFTLTPNTSSSHYIEGWAQLTSATNGEPSIAIPYLGFVGNWNAEKIIDDGSKFGYESFLGLQYQGSYVPVSTSSRSYEMWLSPNGDGNLDYATPVLSLLRNATEARYEIWNSTGTQFITTLGEEVSIRRQIAGMVTRLGGSSRYAASSGNFDGNTWDPQAVAYKNLPDGRYTYRVKAKVGADFDWQTKDFSFGIDTTKPTLYFGSVANGQVGVTVADTGSGILQAPTAKSSNGANLAVTPTGSNTYSIALPTDGSTQIFAYVYDRGLNSTVSSKLVSGTSVLVANTDLLTSSVIGPSSPLVHDGNIDIRGVVNDDISKILVNNQEVTPENGTFSITVPLEEGKNTFTIRAFVGEDQTGEEIVLSPTYDSSAPKVKFDPASLTSDGKLLIGDDGSATVSGTVTDSRAGAELTLNINGQNVSVADDGTFRFTIKDAASLNSLTVSASDQANNTLATLAVPTNNPTATFVEPAVTNANCNGLVTCVVDPASPDATPRGFTVRGTLGDAKRISFQPGDRALSTGAYTSNTPIDANMPGDGTFNITLNLTTGFNDFRVQVYDSTGAVHSDFASSFLFDVTPPTVKFSDPKLYGGTLITNQDSVTFRGSASDDGWGYKLLLNDISAKEVFEYGGIGPASNLRTFEQKIPVQQGDQLLIAFADQIGNALSGLIPVVVDKTAPTADLTGLTAGSQINADTPVTATVNDSYLSNIKVYLDGVEAGTRSTQFSQTPGAVESVLIPGTNAPVKAAATSSETTLQQAIVASAKVPGYHKITVAGTDVAGNTVSRDYPYAVNLGYTLLGPDTLTMNITSDQLVDQAKLYSSIAANYKASLTSDAAGIDPNAVVTATSLSPLVNGQQTVVITTKNQFGVQTTKSITLTLNVGEPVLANTSLSLLWVERTYDMAVGVSPSPSTDQLEYRFLAYDVQNSKWTVFQDWNTSNWAGWATAPGTYWLRVEARHKVTKTYIGDKTIAFAYPKLKGDLSGTTFSLLWIQREEDMAVGAAPSVNTDQIEYRFLAYNVQKNEWRLIQDWNTGNWASWRAASGSYWLRVEARNKVTKAYIGDSTITFQYPHLLDISGTYIGKDGLMMLSGVASYNPKARFRTVIYDHSKGQWISQSTDAWKRWSLSPGNYTALFEVFTSSGELIEQRYYAFQV
ncbi:lactocepin [Arcanobacterium pluranimalium]|uniref:S8 family serine peptidase n=1 Tax=Arcanobacterium pluranimalium TaxID=108028 RepID=UPI00195906BB|nr:S8 family serine peptidase [Arcanobacterium pluranimalium]MBM7824410.1 lactocepin [Arcanobacterium pluranimalium]